MILFTHLSISIKLKHILEKNFHIKLRTLNFLLGSIKPDFSLRYIKIPHYKEGSEAFITEEIQSLLETKLYEYKKCTCQFSDKLGILTHYLSDFFCYAHSEYFTGGMLEHLIYEMKVSMYSAANTKTITHPYYAMDIVTNHNTSSICSYLDKLYIKYLCAFKKADPCVDISFALNACISLCFSVIATCMAEEENSEVNIEEIPA